VLAETENLAASDQRILALFEDAGAVETPTPGVRAWLASDAAPGRRPVLIKRVGGASKGRATEALTLVHPNIVRTRRWMAEASALYVVRDVIRGKSLRQSLAAAGGARPSPELLRKIILPLIDALEYAHGQGLAHGGISPENILIGDDGRIFLSDFATADPKAPQHYPTYAGAATVGGDIKALGRVLATYLPNTGPFAGVVVRGRIEGLIGRCDTLADLRETLNTLEKLAGAPVARSKDGPLPGMPTLDIPFPTASLPVVPPEIGVTTASNAASPDGPAPQMSVTMSERAIRTPQGGGGVATVVVRNEGATPLFVRMIATQHAWLNVRPIDLPLLVPAGGTQQIGFNVSAARLTPGEYRSEVYITANAGGADAETIPGGGFKHTSELRITVEPPGLPTTSPTGEKPPYPANAPKLPGGPGCGAILALGPVLLAGLIAAALCGVQ
jgi:hypothetical protein